MRGLGARWSRLLPRQSLRVFVPIAFAILTVAGAACYLSFALLQRQSFKDSRTELSTLAQLLASEIDFEKHEQLTDPSQMESDLYRELDATLGQRLRALPDVRFIYTLRKVGSKYVFVLDPTPAGDEDQDGVEDKSFLMDAYPEISSTARSVFSTGEAATETELTSDRWGTFLSAYAPIRDAEGRVLAVLGIDKDQSLVLADRARLQRQLWLIFGSCGLIALVFALYLTSRFFRQGRTRHFKSGATGSYLRHSIIEMLLIGLTACCMVSGIVWHGENAQTLRELGHANQKLSRLNQLANEIRSQSSPDSTELSSIQLAGRLKELGLSKLAAMAASTQTDQRGLAGVTRDIGQGLEAERAKLREYVSTKSADAADRGATLLALFIVSAGCALVAVVIIRKALRQQTELADALADTDLAASKYQQVVEQLPVGLFTYSDHQCDFTNAEWDSQFMRQEDQWRHMAFLAAIHPDDRDRVVQCLDTAESTRTTFSTQFRVLRPDGEVLHIESRGAPVFTSQGEFQNLLGFTIDITESVHVQEQLEEKSAIIESNNEQLQRALDDLNVNFEATVRALVIAVDAKDPYTAGHSERVMQYSVRIGHELGLSLEELKILSRGALIHDIGKIGIPDAILTKPHGLTDEEFRVIAEHPTIGYTMIQGIPLFAECAEIVRSHHERLDGTGYPDGLKADEISLLVRIASVADAFDAITSTRAYRQGRSSAEALAILREDVERGKADGHVVEALARILAQTDLKAQIYKEAA